MRGKIFVAMGARVPGGDDLPVVGLGIIIGGDGFRFKLRDGLEVGRGQGVVGMKNHVRIFIQHILGKLPLAGLRGLVLGQLVQIAENHDRLGHTNRVSARCAGDFQLAAQKTGRVDFYH